MACDQNKSAFGYLKWFVRARDGVQKYKKAEGIYIGVLAQSLLVTEASQVLELQFLKPASWKQ